MFRCNLNRAIIRFQIETITPLLIKAGDSGLSPVAPDLSCVRTQYGGLETVYIPGSSLKGVMRSAAEAAVRGRTWGGVKGACDTLGRHSCGQGKLPKDDTAAVHRAHCLACRLFGSTAMRGRAAMRDLYPWPPSATEEERENAIANRTEVRHGVSINRASGSVQHGPFELEMIPAGAKFWGEIVLINFQAWQLALLEAAIAELNDGFAQLGSNKSRGMGVVKMTPLEIIHEQSGKHDAPVGVGQLVDEGERKRYGLLDETPLGTAAGRPRGLATRFELKGDEAGNWLNGCAAALRGLQ